ncbi:lysozyme inhibitor LprI family protein [Acinetobacter sp. ANC 3832]|uniref:lysozyme inhibitor LprI family protein n=1 Tax=Acinetobacter sp. ANC 3832 TaxID=1977874 RepID=UPI001D17CFC2|nr:lysozyme inhibitor LprI family protein [Acinetobacter sp. ANC 3832]
MVLLSKILLSSFSYAKCNNENQIVAYKCLQSELKTEKTKMNQLYQQIYAQYDDKNKQLLEKSQKAWLNYRDVQCNQLLGRLTYGALGMSAGFAAIDCELNSIQFRLKELKSLTL